MKAIYLVLGILGTLACISGIYRLVLGIFENDLAGTRGQTSAIGSLVAILIFLVFTISCFRNAVAKPGKTPPGQLKP